MALLKMADQTTTEAYVGLGANLGDAPATLKWALKEIEVLPQTLLTGYSRLYRSAPVDAQGPDFLNAVARIHTDLSALELLAHLQAIENAAGRERPYQNAPRTLDLDILLYGDCHIESQQLTVPHPRMYTRAFVLMPLHEIAPDLVPASQLQMVQSQRVQQIGPIR